MGKPCIPNVEALIAAGINPKTGLPLKISDSDIKEGIRKCLRILDEQQAVNRYTWENIPARITSQELERLLYYKGQLCFFFHKELGKFYIMPYALDGTIDVYGRYNSIKPVPFSSGVEEFESRKVQDDVLFSSLKLEVIYDEEDNPEDVNNCAVIIHDYTKQISQSILPRSGLQEPIIDTEAECIPYMRTNLSIASGVKPCRVNNADEAKEMTEAGKKVKKCALNGEVLVPFEGAIENQEMFDGTPSKSEEFMLAHQALDNFRKSLIGCACGGVFEKKAHTLESEENLNKSINDLSLADGLKIRKHACDIINKFWKLEKPITVDISEELKNVQGDDTPADEDIVTEGGGDDVSNS